MGVILISLFVLSAVKYTSDLSNNYDRTANLTGFNNTEDRLDDMNRLYNKSFSDQETLEFPGSDFIDAIKFGVTAIRGVWTGVRLFIFDLPRDMFNVLSNEGILPENESWLVLAIFSLLMAAFIIFMIGVYLRYKVG